MRGSRDAGEVIALKGATQMNHCHRYEHTAQVHTHTHRYIYSYKKMSGLSLALYRAAFITVRLTSGMGLTRAVLSVKVCRRGEEGCGGVRLECKGWEGVAMGEIWLQFTLRFIQQPGALLPTQNDASDNLSSFMSENKQHE